MPMLIGGPFRPTATYIYQIKDGLLLAWGPDAANLVVVDSNTMAAAGLASVSGLLALDATHVWDPVKKTVSVLTSQLIPTSTFILLFTAAEAQAIQASTDPQVRQYMLALSVQQQVNLADPVIVGGVNYLASAGLITAQRATQILSGQQPS